MIPAGAAGDLNDVDPRAGEPREEMRKHAGREGTARLLRLTFRVALSPPFGLHKPKTRMDPIVAKLSPTVFRHELSQLSPELTRGKD